MHAPCAVFRAHVTFSTALFRPLVVCVVVLLGLCGAAAGIIRLSSTPMVDEGLRALVSGSSMSGAACAGADAPCWQGIVLGTTTRAQVQALLEAHAWVSQVFETTEALSWKWSGAQPATINAEQDGVVAFERAGAGQVARLLRVGAALPFGAAWLALGPPDDALLVRPVSFSTAYQIAGYGADYGEAPGGVQVITTLHCRGRTLSPRDLWREPFTLGFGELWYTEVINGVRFPIYSASSWWPRLRRCQL